MPISGVQDHPRPTIAGFGLNRYAVFGSTTIQAFPSRALVGSACTPSMRVPDAKAWSRCLQRIPFRKGVSHDGANNASSPAHERRHAGAESRTEYANVLRATGLSLRTPLQQVAGAVGPGRHPHLPGPLD